MYHDVFVVLCLVSLSVFVCYLFPFFGSLFLFLILLFFFFFIFFGVHQVRMWVELDVLCWNCSVLSRMYERDKEVVWK